MMRQLIKIAATAVIVACASLIVRHWVALPYACNNRMRSATDRLKATLSIAGGSLRAAELSRRVIDDLQPCVTASPDIVGAQMVLAASYRELGRNREAAAAYETALQYDRRPELYLNLGQTQIALGDSKSGIQNLVLACIYNPMFLDDVGRYRSEVKQAVDAYQTRLLSGQH